MKILIDQNISHRVIPHIQAEFQNVEHVRNLGLTDANDFQIFQFARKNQFDVIFTLDEDFNNLQLEHSIPPKIVWFRVGNCSTTLLASIIIEKSEVIKNFCEDASLRCLEILN